MTTRTALRPGLAALFALAATVLGLPGPTAAPNAGAADTYRNLYHFTVPDHWKNDPQRPLHVNGAFQYHYLHNADHDQAIGTAWRMATTSTGVRPS